MWGEADLVLKVKEPVAEEYHRLRPGLTLFTYLHLSADRALTESLVADLGGRPMWVPEDRRTLYHAGLAHGANHLVTLVADRGHPRL